MESCFKCGEKDKSKHFLAELFYGTESISGGGLNPVYSHTETYRHILGSIKIPICYGCLSKYRRKTIRNNFLFFFSILISNGLLLVLSISTKFFNSSLMWFMFFLLFAIISLINLIRLTINTIEEIFFYKIIHAADLIAFKWFNKESPNMINDERYNEVFGLHHKRIWTRFMMEQIKKESKALKGFSDL